MRALLSPVLALMASIFILLLGNGLLNVLVPVRAIAAGFSPALAGGLGAVYFIGFTLGCLLGPGIVRRVGHIRAFAIFAAVTAAAALSLPIFPSAAAWLALRALIGVALAALFLIAESWLNEKAPNAARGRVFALYMAVNYAAVSLGQLALGLEDPSGFMLFSLSAMLLTLALVPVSLTRAPAPESVPAVRPRLKRLFALSPVGATATFVNGMILGCFWMLGPVFATTKGMDQGEVGRFMSAAVLAGALSQFPAGKLSDRIDRRLVIIGICLASAAGGAVLALWPHPAFWQAALFGACFAPLYPIAIAHANDHAAPGEFVDVSAGLMLLFGLGSALGPALGGPVMGALGPGALWGLTGACHLFIAGFTLWRLAMKPAPERARPFVPVARNSPAGLELDPRAAESDGAEGA